MSPERLPHVDARIPFPRRSQRKPPRPSRKPQPHREKCVCFLSTCVTESEMDAFETLRLMEAFPPSRSTMVRFLGRVNVNQSIGDEGEMQECGEHDVELFEA